MKKNLPALLIAPFGEDPRSAWTTFFAMLLVVSMTFSPFLLSMSMWGLVAMALWNATVLDRETSGNERRSIVAELLTGLRRSVLQLWRQPAYLFFTLLLLAPALSGLWSGDLSYWADRTRIRLPFLILPWVFVNLPALSARQFRLVLYVLVCTMAVLCIGVGINFILHSETILFGLSEGRPIPVPRHHIRFNLMLATAIIAGGWMWQQGSQGRMGWQRPLLLVLLGILFLFIHFLSVRSGLVALYAALMFSAARFIWRTRRWGVGAILMAVLLAIPLIAVNTVPSLKQRISYMKYDWEHYQSNEGESYSDSERWISLKTGWLMWKEHPVFGVGAGDLPRETARMVTEYFPKYLESPKLPHNQFLYILAGTGLFGLVLSLIAFYAPLLYDRYRRNYLFTTFQVMVFVSFLVEYTIETAMGVAWYLFYSLWFMKMSEDC
ncbi:MAG: O-antigen ligase family protein [Saprospiraceae bacterium]|nr:O-antigen ligase family protein [Saprospiraceae bacterium]